MSTRNKLLEQIVLALGGTVTNPNNRNQLLQDWLNAAGGSPPSTRFIANLNGVSQNATFTAVEISPSLPVTFNFTNFTNAGGFRRFMGSSDFTFSVDTGNNGDKFRLVGCTAILDGQPIVSDTTLIPTTGFHEVVVTPTVTASIDSVGSRSVDTVSLLAAAIYNLKFGDGSVNNFPMDDGWANNPAMRNIGSGADGQFNNLTEASWEEITA